MCGRFGSFAAPEELDRHFGVDEGAWPPPRYNIAPASLIALVRIDPVSERREVALMKWGLVPSWSTNPDSGARLINARSETAAQKPAFRAAFRRRRGLIPADGFYEWSKKGHKKQPHFFRLKEGRIMGLAGLWEIWENGDGEILESCSILTTPANQLVGEIHDRMPLIVAPENYSAWLAPSLENPEEAVPFLPFPAAAMESWPVSGYVNTVGSEGPRCVEPLTETQLSLLP